MIVREGSMWLYQGPDGYGELHKVIYSQGPVIVTMGETHSYLGTPTQFSHLFKQATK